jgi:prophage antirepressor-like protein
MAVVTASRGSMTFVEGVLKLNDEAVQIYFFSDAPEEPWIQAKPVHSFLGAGNLTQTVARVHAEDKASLKELLERKGSPLSGAPDPLTSETVSYHDGKAIYVNESGFYKILLGSQKPEAERLQRWVTREVLPAIRKTGGYSLSNSGVADVERARLECVAACELAASVARGVLKETKVILQLKSESVAEDLEAARERVELETEAIRERARVEKEAARERAELEETEHKRRMEHLEDESRRKVARIREETRLQAAFNRSDTRKKNHELRFRERMVALGQSETGLVPWVAPAASARRAGPSRREEGTGSDPALAAYRAVGISDHDVPGSEREAEAWFQRARRHQLQQRPTDWRNNLTALYPYDARDIYGAPVPPNMCEPPRRRFSEMQ